MNSLLVPLPEINTHSDNHRLSWQLPLPGFARPGDINVSLTGVDAIADASGIDQVFVIPADETEQWTLAKRGFETCTGMRGSDIVADATKSTDWARRVTDSLGNTHAVVTLDTTILREKLRQVGVDERPGEWALYLNRQFTTALGMIGLRNIATRPQRILGLGRALWQNRSLITAKQPSNSVR